MPDSLLPYLGLAAGGTIFAFWEQIKTGFFTIIGYFIVTADVANYDFKFAMLCYASKELKKSRFGVQKFDAERVFVKPENRKQLVGFEILSGTGSLYWKGFIPLWIKVNFGGENNHEGEKVSITYLRGTLNISKVLSSAIDSYNNRDKSIGESRYKIHHIIGSMSNKFKSEDNKGKGNSFYTENSSNRLLFFSNPLKWGLTDLGQDKICKNYAVLDDECEKLLEDVKFWKNNELWHINKGIPWRTGMLFHGVPGTGKTTFARQIAENLDIPVYSFDLASMSNTDFRHEWDTMLSNVPCMALIEDIDSVFDKRKNITEQEGALTFDCFLNCVDGIERSDGVILIITTNRVNKLDSALGREHDGNVSSRPGRIDKIVKFGNLTREVMSKICKKVLDNHPELWDDLISEGMKKKYTVAQFQSNCRRIALELFWKDKER